LSKLEIAASMLVNHLSEDQESLGLESLSDMLVHVVIYHCSALISAIKL